MTLFGNRVFADVIIKKRSYRVWVGLIATESCREKPREKDHVKEAEILVTLPEAEKHQGLWQTPLQGKWHGRCLPRDSRSKPCYHLGFGL